MMNSNMLYFSSINDLMEALDSAPVISGRSNASSKDGDNGSWCDTASWNEAHDNMLVGKVYDDLKTDLGKYKTNGCKEQNKRFLSVEGYSVVVPLYLQGVPTCMINQKKSINNKIVNIYYECSAPWSVDGDDLVKAATNLFKKVIELEQDGYRVNLYLMEVNPDDNGYCYIIKLKSDRETLNIKKLCFPIVSSSFLRRIGFRVKERLFKDWIGGGYGRASFTDNLVKQCVQKLTRTPHYEVWNYEGLKFKV